MSDATNFTPLFHYHFVFSCTMWQDGRTVQLFILAGAVVYFVRATLSATLLTLICIKVWTVYRHIQSY